MSKGTRITKKWIDADGIMQACYDSFLKTNNKAYAEIVALVAVVPAADVAEVRHGHWETIDKGHFFYDWKCSNCGGSGRADYRFCPNCGASMMDEVSE